jgi:hypothetical protein
VSGDSQLYCCADATAACQHQKLRILRISTMQRVKMYPLRAACLVQGDITLELTWVDAAGTVHVSSRDSPEGHSLAGGPLYKPLIHCITVLQCKHTVTHNCLVSTSAAATALRGTAWQVGPLKNSLNHADTASFTL